MNYNPFREPLSLEMREGEAWLITGPNGSGKTTLGRMLTGSIRLREGYIEYGFEALDRVKFIDFRDELSGMLQFHQLKWNQGLRGEDEERVRQVIGVEEMRMFRLEELKERPIMSLSTGELRRLQLSLALKRHPRLLVLDDPATGLDVETAKEMWDALAGIIEKGETEVVVISPTIPKADVGFTHIVRLENIHADAYDEWLSVRKPQMSVLKTGKDESEESQIVRMVNVTVTYGGHRILDNINWSVRRGERWILQGKNGSGKTTLLSLLTGDNPNAYGQNIWLWGKRRGSGESIWDIKRRIGCLNAEMFRAFRKRMAVDALVATGLHEQNGLYHRLTNEDEVRIEPHLRAFGLWGLRKRLYTELSSGEQHRCLLARAFVKEPEMLILDEPFHSLDGSWIARLMEIINTFAARGGTILLVTHDRGLCPACMNREFNLS